MRILSRSCFKDNTKSITYLHKYVPYPNTILISNQRLLRESECIYGKFFPKIQLTEKERLKIGGSI